MPTGEPHPPFFRFVKTVEDRDLFQLAWAGALHCDAQLALAQSNGSSRIARWQDQCGHALNLQAKPGSPCRIL
jgi:hypothetical protein